MAMDNDSAYMALLAPLHMRSFYKGHRDWFSRSYYEKHQLSFSETQIAVYKSGVMWVPGDYQTA